MNPTGRLRTRFFRLTLLNILSIITVPLVGLVDIAMLGHLADIRYLAGVALASILFEYVYWTFGFLRMGTRRLEVWPGEVTVTCIQDTFETSVKWRSGLCY